MEHDLGERVPHPRGRRDGAAGAGLHAARRHRVRAVRRSTPGSTSTTSCRASRSSSTRTATSSRRSRSTARRARSGRTRCATASARKDERSWKLRFHTQTAGVSLTAQQPYNNVVRTALQALSAVLGGTQSLHTNSLDEALALPTAEAATLALRTQQIIAHESGVAERRRPARRLVLRRDSSPLDMERGAREYFETIDAWAAWCAAIERGFPQREIAESAYRFQQAVERREQIIVGVNDFVAEDERAGADALHRRGGRRRARSSALERAAERRATTTASAARSTACRRAAEGAGQHDGAAPRGRARLRDGRRDVRRAPRGVGRVRGSAAI